MHIIDCPDCVNGWQEQGRMDSPKLARCIECDGTGEIEVEDEEESEMLSFPMTRWNIVFVGEQK